MNKTVFDDIVHQLLPEMGNIASRQALVQSALFGSPVLNQIDWSGNARDFTVRLVKKLYDYDTSSLVDLLGELRTQVGNRRQLEIDSLLNLISFENDMMKGLTATMDSSILIGFLIEVGRWAKTELSEIWKLRRKQQATDLTDEAAVETALPEQIEGIVAEKSTREVQRITNLIERKRDAIDRARNAKLADREEYDAQKLTKSAFEQREREHNRTIRQMLNEIEIDLDSLGFDVDRITD